MRKATVNDAEAIQNLHNRSVRVLCKDDYTAEQISGWIERNTVERYRKRLALHPTILAEIEGRLVGFVRWNPADWELCSLFVDPDYTRQGIASRLMAEATSEIRRAGVDEIWLIASLTALPFYLTDGWIAHEQHMHGPLESVRMTKSLA